MIKKFIYSIIFLGFSTFASFSQQTIWAEKIACSGEDNIESIALDDRGHVYVAGSFGSSTLTINNGMSLTNSKLDGNYGNLSKYNSSGTCQ